MTALGGGAGHSAAQHDHEAAAGVIRTLAQLLADDDPGCRRHAREHGALLQAALGDAWPTSSARSPPSICPAPPRPWQRPAPEHTY